ncbi:acyl-CoA dehydrogenase family protein [Oerskovia flava]|uniref:acyl-CoA dehydrogenase family protein n=1 Tax=Oerskovia flava TaxID=2986422 RepID=UPI00224000C2|nr:acyl-CoA dehydrogenase family protein [Oerskovia sp. JB1-3-2]
MVEQLDVQPVRIDSGASTERVVPPAGPPVDAAPDDLPAALAWVVDVGRSAPHPGSGRTLALWELLASTAAHDVALARTLEPHLDALAVLAQADPTPDLKPVGVTGSANDRSWGVFAAEGPGLRLEASEDAGRWTLTGVKPWCSLAAHLSHALVTAWTDDGRRLFAVDLRSAGVQPDDGPWVARGLTSVVSAPVRFDGAVAVPVGRAGWYLDRPGFAWGGIGVAACWYGGAVGVARAMVDRALDTSGREPDQLALAHLGAVDRHLTGARTALAEAARLVDAASGRSRTELPDPPGILARRVRGVVAQAVEETLTRSAHALGPGPLTTDEAFARRVADLGLYVRQHHAERDDASLGRDLLARGERPW